MDSANRWDQERKCQCAWVIEALNTRVRRVHKRPSQMLHEQPQQQTLSRESLDGWQSSALTHSSDDEDDEFLV